MPGPRPKLSRLRAIDGSGKFNPSRMNKDGPKPTGELGPPPKSLTKEAKAVWKERAPYWATNADRTAWARFCQAEADAAMHRNTCEKEGWYIEGSRGTFVRHPASTLYKEACDRADRLAIEFGMTPSSRTRVQVPKQLLKPANDPLAGR